MWFVRSAGQYYKARRDERAFSEKGQKWSKIHIERLITYHFLKKLSHEGDYHINEMPNIRPGLNVALTSDKKSEKFHVLIFHKTQKTGPVSGIV